MKSFEKADYKKLSGQRIVLNNRLNYLKNRQQSLEDLICKEANKIREIREKIKDGLSQEQLDIEFSIFSNNYQSGLSQSEINLKVLEELLQETSTEKLAVYNALDKF